MSQKLAMAISGAVSLGSYEAGVMYEILEAIRQHNHNLLNDTKLTPSEKDRLKIEIDVITGASAGAMTACILAQKLMFEGERLQKPFDNDLYNPWVREVDIDRLIKFTENPDFSILSSEEVKRIGEKYLLERYTSPDDRFLKSDRGLAEVVRGHEVFHGDRHLAAAQELYIGLAMANLNGIDYKRDVSVGMGLSEFVYSRFQDRYLAKIQTQKTTEAYEPYSPGAIKIITDDRQSWELMENLARSSGSFPFAFRPVAVTRQAIEYPDNQTINKAAKTFTYTDGGVFENEPLGMAQELATRIDRRKPDNSRFYLFVAPQPKSSSSNNINESVANLLATAQALVRAIFNQARFRDWIIVSQGKEIQLKQNPPQETNIYSVIAEEQDLVGEGISAFVGFFEEDYRKYDYFKGRIKARELLKSFKDNSDRNEPMLQLNRFEFAPEQLILQHTKRSPERLEELASSQELALDEVERQTRIKIKKLLLNRLDRLIDLVYRDRGQFAWLRKRSPIRFIAKKFLNLYLSGKINELLRL